MSDDSQPPPLRLKPRLRPEEKQTGGENAPAAGEKTQAQSPVSKEGELKPRLNIEAAPAQETPKTDPATVAGSVAPAKSTEEKLRLRFPSSDTSSGPPVEAPAPKTPVPQGTPPLFVPALAPEPPLIKPSVAPAFSPVRPASAAPVTSGPTSPPLPPVLPPAERKGFKIGVTLTACAVLLALAGAGYAAWNWFLRDSDVPPAPLKAAGAAIPPSAAPSATAPINRTQKVLAERRESEALKSVQTGELVGETPQAPQTQAKTDAPQTPSPQISHPATSAPQPGVPGVPSEAFKQYVANLSIRGVFQGTPARILIGRTTIQQGEWADRQLGIRFEAIDAQSKTVTFREVATDSTLTRKY